MSEIPASLQLTVGEQRSFELPGLGTAGYLWQHEVRGDEHVIDVQWSRGFADGGPRATAGASAPETATVRALHPGTAELALSQRRPWEPASQARNELHVSVVVEPRS